MFSDDRPAHENLGLGSLERRRHDLGAELAEPRRPPASSTGSPSTGTDRTATSPFSETRISPDPKRESAASADCKRSSARRDLAGRGAAGDDDIDRIGRRFREVALERDEALLGDEAVGQGGHAAGADVHGEDRKRERDEHAKRREQRLRTGRRSTLRTIAPQNRPSAPPTRACGGRRTESAAR